jgi:hypothetical protein
MARSSCPSSWSTGSRSARLPEAPAGRGRGLPPPACAHSCHHPTDHRDPRSRLAVRGRRSGPAIRAPHRTWGTRTAPVHAAEEGCGEHRHRQEAATGRHEDIVGRRGTSGWVGAGVRRAVDLLDARPSAGPLVSPCLAASAHDQARVRTPSGQAKTWVTGTPIGLWMSTTSPSRNPRSLDRARGRGQASPDGRAVACLTRRQPDRGES